MWKLAISSCIAILSLSQASFAGMGFELLGNYQTDTFTRDSAETKSQTIFQGSLVVDITHKKKWFATFSATSISIGAATDTTSKFSALDFAPGMILVVDRKDMLSVGVGYTVVSKATFDDGLGGSSLNWGGTGYWASIGVMPEIGDDLYLGFRLLYYQTAYTKQDDGTTASDISYKRALVLPLVGISYRF